MIIEGFDSKKINKERSFVIVDTVYSPILKMDCNYSIYLPRQLDNIEVFYFLHGSNGNHTNFLVWLNIKSILDRLSINVVGIFIDGYNSFYVNGYGIKMEDVIIQDLIPNIEGRHNLKVSNKQRNILGISMGGYGALRLYIKYNQLFNSVIAVSPAIWETVTDKTYSYNWHVFRNEKGFDNDFWKQEHPTQLLKNYKNKEPNITIYTGKEDTVVYYKEVEKFVKSCPSIEYYLENEGDHSWNFWNEIMEKSFDLWVLSHHYEKTFQ